MAITAVIIVTHNSQDVLPLCLESLVQQSREPDTICIVDSGSDDTRYLTEAEEQFDLLVVRKEENVGFARGNNAGVAASKDRSIDYLLFINPDTFLHRDALDRATRYMHMNPRAALVTGLLRGYDLSRRRPTGRIDSAGIFRKWYGRWYDRGQGEMDDGQYPAAENIPAACGAFMFCRKKALMDAALGDDAVFDEDIFLYKEDIELCLRLREKGWFIGYSPELMAYHGRGWQGSRKNMSRNLRITAARSEVLLYKKHPSPYMLWAMGKYVLVSLFNV